MIKSKEKNAFVLMHFGSNPKYIEYEIYAILMLKNILKNNPNQQKNIDIVYFYSINDTPDSFLKVIEPFDVKLISFDDKKIIDASLKFNSVYQHFNTLRTCCFVYLNQLTEYNKVCLVESDIILYPKFINVFKLNCPAINFHTHSFLKNKTNDRVKKLINKSPEPKPLSIKTKTKTKAKTMKKEKGEEIDIHNSSELLNKCIDFSPVNGGVMLIKPDITLLNTFEKIFIKVINANCSYPNEYLFLLMFNKKNIYNLPVNYNSSIYPKMKYEDVYAYHFYLTNFKQIDYIEDDYIEKVKYSQVKKALYWFKEKFYDKYNSDIKEIMKHLQF